MRDPESAARLQRMSEAAQRVAALQAESARLAQAMSEAEADQAADAEQRERRARSAGAALIAEAEVAAAEKLLQAAQLQAQAAEYNKSKWASDASEVRACRQLNCLSPSLLVLQRAAVVGLVGSGFKPTI